MREWDKMQVEWGALTPTQQETERIALDSRLGNLAYADTSDRQMQAVGALKLETLRIETQKRDALALEELRAQLFNG